MFNLSATKSTAMAALNRLTDIRAAFILKFGESEAPNQQNVLACYEVTKSQFEASVTHSSVAIVHLTMEFKLIEAVANIIIETMAALTPFLVERK